MGRNNPSAGLSWANVAILLLAGLGAFPAAAAVRDLASCQQLAERDPAQALEAVKDWAAHGGGDRAQLCRAAALFVRGDFAGAGDAFEALAEGPGTLTDRQRAQLYDRAGWAYLRGGDGGRAARAYDNAVGKAPDDMDLRVDRGIARAETGHQREAIIDFTAVLEKQPLRADIYYFRATTYRQLGDLKAAGADVDASLRLRPDDGEALVLRGTLRVLAGNRAAGEADWRAVMAREPDSPAGRAAAANLKGPGEPAPAARP